MKKNSYHLRFFSFWIFSTNNIGKKIEEFESNKFIKSRFAQPKILFNKEFLVAGMPHNIIYFCLWNWELSNAMNQLRTLISITNKASNLMAFNLSYNEESFLAKFSLDDINDQQILFRNVLITIIKFKILLFDNLNLLKKQLLETFSFFNSQAKVHLNLESEKFKKQSKVLPTKRVWSFLLVWSTKNNFFVTVIDSKGHTLVTWTGGNSERTGTRQRSTVFSADNAVYEACFLAKQRGVESLALHVWSTFWLPQIKNCFEGLDASGLAVDELLYWPLWAFGGCRRKKPRRV